ncbi:MAG: hypothetical protein H7Z17_05210 [Fuerstia sp.]|nr:hypothetical protein [Fuerstiella sp.]
MARDDHQFSGLFSEAIYTAIALQLQRGDLNLRDPGQLRNIILEAAALAQEEMGARGLNVTDTKTGRVVIREEKQKDTRFQFTSPLVPGTYRAWVKAINAATNRFSDGAWSRAFDFTVTAAEPVGGDSDHSSPGQISERL